MSLEYFATVSPVQDAPEAAVRMQVEVFSFSQTECNHVDGWDLPTRFTHAELLRTFDAHKWVVLTGGDYEYVTDAEAFDNKEVAGLRITFGVIDMPTI